MEAATARDVFAPRASSGSPTWEGRVWTEQTATDTNRHQIVLACSVAARPPLPDCWWDTVMDDGVSPQHRVAREPIARLDADYRKIYNVPI
jgi:hypothetical protein